MFGGGTSLAAPLVAASARAANATLTQQLDEARRQKDAAVQQQDVVVELLNEMLIATGYQY